MFFPNKTNINKYYTEKERCAPGLYAMASLHVLTQNQCSTHRGQTLIWNQSSRLYTKDVHLGRTNPAHKGRIHYKDVCRRSTKSRKSYIRPQSSTSVRHCTVLEFLHWTPYHEGYPTPQHSRTLQQQLGNLI